MIVDSIGRTFKTLRVSLVRTCNFACVYCVKSDKEVKAPLENIISARELLQLIFKIDSRVKLENIRLTGGEPLLYPELETLIKELSAAGIYVKLTTNGFYLKEKIKLLASAGLKSINISLDSLDPDNFYKMTRRKNLDKVLEGIDAAISEGVEVKINSVIVKDENENQILPLLEFAGKNNISIRFLELMKMGHLYDTHDNKLFSESEILDLISEKYIIEPLERKPGSTAKYWTTGKFQFGIISNTSDPFCSDCNRLRLDSYGNIYGCLSSELGLSIRESDEADLEDKLKIALAQKKNSFTGSNLSMKFIGG